jgi:hypothetical protein
MILSVYDGDKYVGHVVHFSTDQTCSAFSKAQGRCGTFDSEESAVQALRSGQRLPDKPMPRKRRVRFAP